MAGIFTRGKRAAASAASRPHREMATPDLDHGYDECPECGSDVSATVLLIFLPALGYLGAMLFMGERVVHRVGGWACERDLWAQ